MKQKEMSEQFSFADLRMLLDYYQNIMQTNTIMLEQQKQLLITQKDMIRKGDDSFKHQMNFQSNMALVIDKTNLCIQNLSEMHNIVTDVYTKLNNLITNKFDRIENKLEKININTTKDHGKISNKIYIALGGSITIILSLIALLNVVYSKYEIVKNIEKMTYDIFQYLNIN